MLKKYILFIIVATLCGVLANCATVNTERAPPRLKTDLRVASFNIHYLVLNDEEIKNWNARKPAVTAMITDIDADILAFQEMESFGRGQGKNQNLQLDFVLQRHPDYAAAAYSDDADQYPITQPIIYRKDRLEVLDQGFFFFSETPDVIYARTFNGNWPAFCSWATFKDNFSGKTFTVFNMHTDYSSGSNRVQSSELMAAYISPRVSRGESVLLVGDLNASQSSKSAGILKDIPLSFVETSGSTFHFNRGINLTPAIDHILHTPDFTPLGNIRVIRQKYDGTWPGDHYPIVADFRVKAGLP